MINFKSVVKLWGKFYVACLKNSKFQWYEIYRRI